MGRKNKKINKMKQVTSGRHSESPGEDVTHRIPHPNKPADRPHIRADSMSVVNFRMEKTHNNASRLEKDVKHVKFSQEKTNPEFKPVRIESAYDDGVDSILRGNGVLSPNEIQKLTAQSHKSINLIKQTPPKGSHDVVAWHQDLLNMISGRFARHNMAQQDKNGDVVSLKKGVMRRKAPFKPQDIPAQDRAQVEAWVLGAEGDRDEMPRIEGNARVRALHKLHSTAISRRNPKTNEREFLLHRGMTASDIIHPNKKINSFSTKPQVAKIFNDTFVIGMKTHKDYAKHLGDDHPLTKEVDPKGGFNPEDVPSHAHKNLSHIYSSWVPESAIHHVPFTIGAAGYNKGEFTEGDHKIEGEVLIDTSKVDKIKKYHVDDGTYSRIKDQYNQFRYIMKFGKSEGLQKGAMRRKAPFDHKDISNKERKPVEYWVATADPQDRNDIPRLEGNARTRAIHKLHGKVHFRRNMETGEREFLLHRGLTIHDIKNGHPPKGGLSSYTSDPRIARGFNVSAVRNIQNSMTQEYNGRGLELPPDHPLVSSWNASQPTENHWIGDEYPRSEELSDLVSEKFSKIHSAWVPESAIHHVPDAIGFRHSLYSSKWNTSLAPKYKEGEVIIDSSAIKDSFLTDIKDGRILEDIKDPTTYDPEKDQKKLTKLKKAPEVSWGVLPSIEVSTPSKHYRYPEDFKPLHTYKAGDNFHHVWKDVDEDYVVHILSSSSDPFHEESYLARSDGREYLPHMGASPNEHGAMPVQLQQSLVRTRGMGHGKELYNSILAHHGSIKSDTLLSPGSHMLYATHFKKNPYVDTQVEEPNDPETSHVVSVKPGQMREYRAHVGHEDYFQPLKIAKSLAFKLEKGVMKRIAPFDPHQVAYKDRKKTEDWTYGYDTAWGDSDVHKMPRLEGPARQRALHKLHGLTHTRRNPETGEREFWLHRGVTPRDMRSGGIGKGREGIASYTPLPSVAKGFARTAFDEIKDYGPDVLSDNHPIIQAWVKHHGSVHEYDDVSDAWHDTDNKSLHAFLDTQNLTQVHSAWVPESAIHHVPYAWGSRIHIDGKISAEPQTARVAPPNHRSEFEVVVDTNHIKDSTTRHINSSEFTKEQSEHSHKFPTSQKQLGKSTSKLEKGVMRRLAPFNPRKDIKDRDIERVGNWVAGHGERGSIPKLKGAARTRGLHKLHARTETRKNPETGDREFLLHRGMGKEEYMKHQGHQILVAKNPETSAWEQKFIPKDGSHIDSATSWTYDKNIAQGFADAYTEGGDSHLVSAWVPEKHIKHPLFMTSSTSRGYGEGEILVSPHKINIRDSKHLKQGTAHNANITITPKAGSAVKKSGQLEKGARGDWKAEGYTIKHKIIHLSGVDSHWYPEGKLKITAHDASGKVVGGASLNHAHSKTLMLPRGIWVDEGHERKGLASAMYAHAEKVMGKKVVPQSNSQSPAGAAIWKQLNRPFGRKNEKKIDEYSQKDLDDYNKKLGLDKSISYGGQTNSLKKSVPNGYLYVQMDGDNAGTAVKIAAYNNKIEDIADISRRIEEGSLQVLSFAESLGAKVVIKGGDDLSFLLPEEHESKIDDMKKIYKDTAGFTATLGYAKSIPHAIDALIYGKLTGKDKVVQWTPEISGFVKSQSEEISPQQKYSELVHEF